MALIVQKFGGTSVGSIERIRAVAQRVKQTVKAGHSVVVVVSAMGKMTDQLVKLASEITADPDQRELDMLLATGEQAAIALLSMALQNLGQSAVSLTGAQIGIITETKHNRAHILHIHTQRLQHHLNEGSVVVVAGFQGMTESDNWEITTLGRGGSDTTAVALAATLKANLCEIYTDVPGIFNADPRLVETAQLITEITCDEMLELASMGAQVLHPRSVEIARNYGIPLVVRSSWTDDPGTRIIPPIPQCCPREMLELSSLIDSVKFDTDCAKVAVLQVPDRPGVAATLFHQIAEQALSTGLILQSIHEDDTNDIAFTVNHRALSQAHATAMATVPLLSAQWGDCTPSPEVLVYRDLATVTIMGAGMLGYPGVAAQMFTALADAEINLHLISTSGVSVSCVIQGVDCDRAITTLCETFHVASSPLKPAAEPCQHPSFSASSIRGVALDLNQACLTLRQIPDRPGKAARVFQLLAEQSISVDMIVQSQRRQITNGRITRDIAFTLPEGDVDVACRVLRQAATELENAQIEVDRAIAKVSIVGSHLSQQQSSAFKMFTAIATHRINIQMIATSALKVSCVVSSDQGVEALRAVHTAFGLAGHHKIKVPA